MRPYLLTVAAALVVACSSSGVDTDDPMAAAAAVSSSTTAIAESAPSVETTTTVAQTTSTSVAPTTTTTSSATTTLPAFPDQKQLFEHGGEAWAVYLAVAAGYEEPALADAAATAQSYGFSAATGDLACDAGGAEATGLDPSGSWAAVGVYFDTESEAMHFVNALVARGHSVVGFGAIQTHCLD